MYSCLRSSYTDTPKLDSKIKRGWDDIQQLVLTMTRHEYELVDKKEKRNRRRQNHALHLYSYFGFAH